uniref:Uncharacterized protein n=1 Tax=Sipha flava TaxID=143950 RepID=A0A2S2PXA1_9HEMI
MAKFNMFNRNFALLLTIFVAAQAMPNSVDTDEDEYVDKTVKDNAPGLVSHMIGGGGMNLKKLAAQAEIEPLKMNDFEPETVQTRTDYLMKTVDEDGVQEHVNGQSINHDNEDERSAAQDIENTRSTVQDVQDGPGTVLYAENVRRIMRDNGDIHNAVQDAENVSNPVKDAENDLKATQDAEYARSPVAPVKYVEDAPSEAQYTEDVQRVVKDAEDARSPRKIRRGCPQRSSVHRGRSKGRERRRGRL